MKHTTASSQSDHEDMAASIDRVTGIKREHVD